MAGRRRAREDSGGAMCVRECERVCAGGFSEGRRAEAQGTYISSSIVSVDATYLAEACMLTHVAGGVWQCLEARSVRTSGMRGCHRWPSSGAMPVWPELQAGGGDGSERSDAMPQLPSERNRKRAMMMVSPVDWRE